MTPVPTRYQHWHGASHPSILRLWLYNPKPLHYHTSPEHQPHRSQSNSVLSYYVSHSGERSHPHVIENHPAVHTFTSHIHRLLLKEPTTVLSLCPGFAALTFILNRHSSLRSFHVSYPPRLVVLAAHIPTLGLILYLIDTAKSLNPVSFMSDFPNDLIPASYVGIEVML